MRLNEISDKVGATKPRKRVGRALARAWARPPAKGTKARRRAAAASASSDSRADRCRSTGGYRSVGSRSAFRAEYVVINLGALQRAVEQGRLDTSRTIDEPALQAAGLFSRRRDGVRLLAKGELTAALTIQVTGASKTAIAAVEKAGGSISFSGTVGPEAPPRRPTRPPS